MERGALREGRQKFVVKAIFLENMDVSAMTFRIFLGLVLAGCAAGSQAVTFEKKPSLFPEDAPSGLGDRYGMAVAIDGDTVAIGVGKRSGPTAYSEVEVWVRREGAWQRQAVLPNPSVSGRFGQALALEGDLLLVGAPSAGDAQDPGSVVPYRRVDGEWIKQAALRGSDRASGDSFGHAVALEEGRALIGAPGKDGAAGENSGALYVFEASGLQWGEAARLEAPDGHAGDLLGASVAWSGDLALGGAVGADVGSALGQGAVEGFVRDGSGWRHRFTLLAADGAGGDSFGIALAADAQRVVVGAHLDMVEGRADAGSARVFARSGDVFVSEATLVDTDEGAGALGYSVALAGDIIVLGGRATTPRVFRRGAGGWSRSESPHAPSGDAVEAVAIAADTLAMGAPGTDVGASTDRGVAGIAAFDGGIWVEQTLLTSGRYAQGTTFGYTLDIDEGQALIGGPGLCTGFCPSTFMPGAAYFWRRVAGGALVHERTLTGQPARYGDGFAHAVSIRGARALIASGGGFYWEEQPGVFVYERDAAGWHRSAELRDAQGAALVATHVAIDGDVAVAGNRFDLHLFHRQADGTWRHEMKFPAGLRGSYGLTALALDGDTVALGIADFPGEEVGQGIVYLLGRRDGRWFLDARLLGDSRPHSGFGAELALDGDRLLVGEQGHREAAVAGGVLAFERGSFDWHLTGRLSLPSVVSYRAGLALRGDVAFAFADEAVHAFEQVGGQWLPAGSIAAAGPRLAFDGETLLVSRWDSDLDQTREVEVYAISR